MKMKKNFFRLGLATSLVLGGLNVANAADTATVKITGRVIDATCDVAPQGLTGNTLDLGGWAPTAFVDATTKVGTKPFSVGLSNCTGTTDATKNVYLTVSGNSMAGAPDLFADLGTQTVGVELAKASDGSVVKNGDAIQMSDAADAGDPTKAGGKVVQFNASMVDPNASATVHPAAQNVQATLVFAVDYK